MQANTEFLLVHGKIAVQDFECVKSIGAKRSRSGHRTEAAPLFERPIASSEQPASDYRTGFAVKRDGESFKF